MKKKERQLLIKQIVLDHDVATQEELLQYLREEGVEATQATISRDIKELNLIKTPALNGSTKYTLFQHNQSSLESKLEATLQDVVIQLTKVQFVNVMKTLPGNAHVVGALLDDLSYPEIVGTVAGHDTCLIISKDEKDADKVHNLLKKYTTLTHNES
ncbi:arginine repressor [Atopococcus tabaci]|uniref:arginine repressor n=1 Tax=Atopococcus tabaci TaxID=269774 RepID=UPI00040901C0|nr:arginine repressor [Atopococcus tabaci]